MNPSDNCHSQDTARSPGPGGRAVPAAGCKGQEVFTPHPAAGPSCCSTFDCLVTGHRVEKFLEKSTAAWAVFVCWAQTLARAVCFEDRRSLASAAWKWGWFGSPG